MSKNIVAGSSTALYNYAKDLDLYINETSRNILALIDQHREVGYSWNDRLYEDFTSVITEIKNKMIIQLEELTLLNKKITEKAQVLEELEKTTF